MLPIIGALASTVVSSVVDHFKDKQELKKAEKDAKLKVLEAKTEANIQKMLTQQQGDIAWENTQISNSGWKDEYWTIVLSIPAIGAFFPPVADDILRGFEVLEQMPFYYQSFLGGAIAVAFGLKKFADIMSIRKGA